jgi:DNA polymerase-1
MSERRPLLMLIDGHALAFRAFHALSDANMRASSGEPTYAVYGFVSIMLTAIQDYHPAHLAVSFDVGRTFRDDLYAEYKAGRGEAPAEFHPQLDRIKQLVRAFNIPIYTADGFEADDVIGTLARQATQAGADTLILTGDTDTLQLVDAHVRVLLANPYARGGKNATVYDEEQVRERYKGLSPNQLADLRGLKGDTSDNIPGVKGIGEAGAIALLNQFGTVESLFDRLDEAPKRYQKVLDGQRDAALFSKKLATIVCDAPVALDLQAAALHDYDRAQVIDLFHELEFGAGMVKRLPVASGAAPERGAPEPELAELPLFARAAEPAPAGDDPQQLAMFDLPPARAAALAGQTEQRAALGSYQAVRTREELAAVVSALSGATAFAFDTELTGLNPLADELVGVSLAVEPGYAWYIPFGHREDGQLPRQEVLDALRPFFADPRLAKYGHNAKFDIEALEHAGVEVRCVTFDTMLAATLLDKRKGLKDLAFYELKLPEPMTGIEELIGKGKKQITFAEVPIETAVPYAAADADMTLRLHQALQPQLAAQPHVAQIFEMEMRLLPVVVQMEQAGIGVDEAMLRELGQQMGQQIADLEAEIHSYSQQPFNINSSAQLADVLFGKLGLPTAGVEQTKTGQYSLTAAALEALRDANQDNPNSHVIDLILRYRQLGKLKSTYVDALPDLVNPQTGRIHTTYSQIGAATGRMASNSPNLQNIPTRTDDGREIRRAFVAAPSHRLVAADYSQIELRVLAHVTRDPNLVRVFQEDQDIHAATASELFGVAIDQVNKNQRRVAKTVVFGVIYGISSFGLAPRIGTSRSEAQALIDALFARFPGIRAYINDTLKRAEQDGYVQSLFGRRRYFPELKAGGARKQAAQREAINAPIQATAADIMKLAMIKVADALRDQTLASRMLLQVHDELIFEAPEAELDPLVRLVCEQMEGAFDLSVPLKVDVEQGQNWLQMEDVGSKK